MATLMKNRGQLYGRSRRSVMPIDPSLRQVLSATYLEANHGSEKMGLKTAR